MRALLRYKFLEEGDLKEVKQEEAPARREETVEEVRDFVRIGFDDLRRMIEESIDGGVELVKEYERLLMENPGDHYFESLSWPLLEKYELRRKSNRPEGVSFSLGAHNLRTYDGCDLKQRNCILRLAA